MLGRPTFKFMLMSKHIAFLAKGVKHSENRRHNVCFNGLREEYTKKCRPFIF